MGVVGMDTSCYRTSVAWAGADGSFFQYRELLRVEQGARGLMQSQGVFQHVGNLPALTERLFAQTDETVEAVCVSCAPRPVEGSYMPVFTVGEGFARALAAALRVPLLRTTHQQGHVRAALVDSGLTAERFLALHLSGGTTELLLADRALNLQLLGGTGDLNAGQLVDRIGVRLGLGFPSGPELEKLAVAGDARSVTPNSVRGLACSFSGAEAQLMRMIDAGQLSREDAAAEVYSAIARAIAKLIAGACAQTGVYDVLLAGGVASSELLKKLIPARLKRLKCGARLYWARPELSGDNAVGVALIGRDLLMKGNE